MKIAAAVNISRSPREVFAWIADPNKAIRWQRGVKSGEILHEAAERVGTLFREEMEQDGKTLVMQGRITEFIQDQLISFHLDSRIHQVDVAYSVEGNEDDCTLTLESTIRWKLPMSLVGFVFGTKIRENILRQTRAEFAELKRLCETPRQSR